MDARKQQMFASGGQIKPPNSARQQRRDAAGHYIAILP